MYAIISKGELLALCERPRYVKRNEETGAYVEAAEFADSGETKIGDPIIALSAGYVSFGMVTAQPYLYLCDGSYQRINTDIIGKTRTAVSS